MTAPGQRRTYSLLPGHDVQGIVKDLRRVGAAVGVAMALVVGLGVAAVVVRALRPVGGGMAPVVVVGVAGLAALGGAMALLEITGRRARRADTLRRAASTYKVGCAAAGALNFLAGCATVAVVFANGVSGGLWVPAVLILALNALGLVLALPRIKHLRSLHYSPTLPVTRV